MYIFLIFLMFFITEFCKIIICSSKLFLYVHVSLQYHGCSVLYFLLRSFIAFWISYLLVSLQCKHLGLLSSFRKRNILLLCWLEVFELTIFCYVRRLMKKKVLHHEIKNKVTWGTKYKKYSCSIFFHYTQFSVLRYLQSICDISKPQDIRFGNKNISLFAQCFMCLQNYCSVPESHFFDTCRVLFRCWRA